MISIFNIFLMHWKSANHSFKIRKTIRVGPKTNWIVGTSSDIEVDENTYIIDKLEADGQVCLLYLFLSALLSLCCLSY